MRHFPIALCVSATLGYASLAAAAGTGPLAFTLDLMAPCSAGACTGTHPTDIALDLSANSFLYQVDSGSPAAYVAQLAVTAPVVCNEISSNGANGPASTLRFSPTFTNPSPGGLLEFGAGGASVVDLGAVSYDGRSPAGVTGLYSNLSSPQVTCYQINPLTGGPIAKALGPSGIFGDGFEGAQSAHFADEPWLSVQTVVSPQSAARRISNPNSITPANALGYVVEVHNATAAAGWRLNLGYDYAFFDSKNGDSTITAVPKWCVLGAGIPQPGPVNGSASCSSAAVNHTLASSEIAPGSNSIFIYGEYSTSVAGTTAWSSLTGTSYPAVAAIFPPFGKYPQRFDDKLAVVGPNNRPVLNVDSIIASNDSTSTTTTLRNHGNALPAALTFQNAVSGGGAVTVDPIAYFVDPNSNTTLPGTTASDGITVSNVSCSDPQGILAGGIGTGNFAQSTAARGGLALSFNFASAGSLFAPGTATCTATFTAAGYSPAISTTETFSITMPQAAVGSVAVSAAPSQSAAPGGTVGYTLAVANAGSAILSNVGVNNPLAANVQSLSWTCTPAGGASCPAASGNAAISHSVASIPVGGSVSYAITATLKSAASFVSAAQVSNAASITVPGGSCTGGNCSSSASVATVPLIHLTLNENPSSYANSGDGVTYTIALANEGGTDASGVTLVNPGVAGLSFGAWTCTATGGTSACPNASGTGVINETAIAIAAGGNVSYSLPGTVTVSSGNITDAVTVGPGTIACVGGVCTAQQVLTGP